MVTAVRQFNPCGLDGSVLYKHFYVEAFEKGYVRCPDKDVGVIFSIKRRKIKDSEIPWTHDEKGNYQLKEDADYYNPFIPIHEVSESKPESKE